MRWVPSVPRSLWLMSMSVPWPSNDDFPTGIIVFLLTDIEGSTGRWEADRDAMAALVESHDRIISGAVQAHSGVLFSSAGDSHGAAFHTAADAVSAALEAQHGLRDVIPVRMAVHVGPAQERDGNYYGPTLNRGGRLRDAAHGGQVVCSQAVIDLLGDHPIGVDVADLGEHRLKDLGRPEHVYQLSRLGLGVGFPTLKTLTVESSNLPVQVNSFVGRYQEMAEIGKALHGSRLVTLTGPGGCGKSRLALEVAAEVFDEFPDGVWLVGLAPVVDPDLVPQAVATVLEVRERSGVTLTEAVVTYLKRRRMLLVIDNCEHLLDPAADLVAAIVSGTPDVSVLATSREPLHTHGESIYPVPPLPLPEPDAELVELAFSDSVRLFVERAAAAHPDFHLTANNSKAIASICRHLDGIPLAIELAAATTRMFGPDQIEERLGDRFRLLRRGPRGDLPHHQTLEAAIDWSHRLLTPQQQTLFARLAVFEGGWTLEAAEAVCSGNGLDQTEVLPLLADLVDRSLVVSSNDGPQPRYRFLETVGVYASEQNGIDPGLALSHAHHYLAFAQQLAPLMETDQTVQAMDAYTADMANLRAALHHFDHTGNADDYCQLLISMRQFLHFRRMFTDVERWLEKATEMASDQLDPSLRGQLLLQSANNAQRGWRLNREAALGFLHRSLPLFTKAGDDRHLSEALAYLAVEEDPTYGDQALQAAIRSGDKYALALVHHYLGVASDDNGDCPTALEHFQQALTAEPGIHLRAFISMWMGQSHRKLGNIDRAQDFYNQALQGLESLHDPAGLVQALLGLSFCYVDIGDPQAGFDAIHTAIDIQEDHLGQMRPELRGPAARASIMIGDIEATLHHLKAVDTTDDSPMNDDALLAVALLALHHRNPADAATSLAAEHSYRIATIGSHKAREDNAHNLIDRTRSLLDSDQFDAAWTRGINMNLNEIIELALTKFER